MNAEQLELFAEYAKKKSEQPTPQAATQTILLEIEGQSIPCSDLDISKMEQKFGPLQNDDGVDFWWLLRQLMKDGAKRVKLI